MNYIVTGLALAAALVLPDVAAAAEPETLQPTSQWEATREGNMCLLVRHYQDSKGKPVDLMMRPDLLDDGVLLLIVRDDGAGDVRNDNTTITTADGSEIKDLDADTHKMANGKWISFIPTHFSPTIGSPPKDKDEEASARRTNLLGSEFAVSVKKQFDYRFMTPGAAVGRNILLRCVEAVRTEFGVTQNDIDRVAEKARMKDVGLTSADYPAAMLRKNLMARPLVFIWTNEEGKVDDCKLLEGAGYPEFDKIICKRMIQSTRYHPARDADGNPIRAPKTERVRFEIPT